MNTNGDACEMASFSRNRGLSVATGVLRFFTLLADGTKRRVKLIRKSKGRTAQIGVLKEQIG